MEQRKEYRILFLVDIYPHHGGVVTVSESLGNVFKERGHKVYLLSLRKNSKVIPPTGIFEAVETMPEPIHFETNRNKAYTFAFTEKYKIEIVINQALVSSIDNYLPPPIKVINVTHSVPFWELEDIRYSVSKQMIVQAKGIGKKISMCRKYILNRLYPQRKRHFIKNHYEQHLKNGAAFVCLTQGYRREMAEQFPAYRQKLFSIANPISIDPLVEKREKEKIVLYVGRLSRFDKRPDRLLKIWKKVEKADRQGWKLLIVGDGDERESIEKYAKKNQLKRVFFEGYQDPSSYYKRASLLALTSSIEGFPMVLLEAQQQSVVPIAFNCTDGVSVLLDKGNSGLLIPCFNKKRFAQELLSLMGNQKKREQLSTKGKESLERYNPNYIGKEWETLFDSITRAPHSLANGSR